LRPPCSAITICSARTSCSPRRRRSSGRSADTSAAAASASTEAAVSAAAYDVLKALFPNRGAQDQHAYAHRLAAIPDGQAKTLGLALGSEVAAEVVRLRANDGRMVALAL
jgi:hypothetical protein